MLVSLEFLSYLQQASSLSMEDFKDVAKARAWAR